MAVGTATLDFSSTPKAEASVAVTGQSGILAGSRVEAWLRLDSTETRGIDEILMEDMNIVAGNIVPGTGFTIYGIPRRPPVCGVFKIDWVWI